MITSKCCSTGHRPHSPQIPSAVNRKPSQCLVDSQKHAFLDIPREPGLPQHTDPIPRMSCKYGLHKSESRPRVFSPLEVGSRQIGGIRQGLRTEMGRATRWDYVAVIAVHPPAARILLDIGGTVSCSLRSSVEFWRNLENWHADADTH